MIKWNSASGQADDAVVTVLSARTSEKKVKWYVEQRYIDEIASLDEKISYALYNQPTIPPYRARLENGRIDCGHNPWLEAFIVNGLRVETDADGAEVLKWDSQSP